MRYADKDISVGVFLALKKPMFNVTSLNETKNAVNVSLVDMGDASSIDNATWSSGVNSTQTVTDPPTELNGYVTVISTSSPPHLKATADVNFKGYPTTSIVIIDTDVN